MEFSLMFWGDLASTTSFPDYYQFVLNVCRYADANGFKGVWLPERHFHPWGGAHPNPSVLAAAVAAVTQNIRIRAGSVVLPLHNPLRVAEEWAVVDNLSRGRVELSVASGWKEDDFALSPESYEKRKEILNQSLATLQNLWQKKSLQLKNGLGQAIEPRIYPDPVQKDLTVWITSAGSLRTMTGAGSKGLNLLTHMLGQDLATLEKNIGQYKAYRARQGFQQPGEIALMLHAFLSSDEKAAKEAVRPALQSYLLNSADLAIPQDRRAEWATMSEKDRSDLMGIAMDRYIQTASLIGSVASTQGLVKKLKTMGITDLCCLVDFGMGYDQVMTSLAELARLRKEFSV